MSDRRIETRTDLPDDAARAVLDLIEAAAAEDGQPAVSEQGRLHIRKAGRPGVRHLLLWTPTPRPGPDGTTAEELTGYGQIDGTDPVEAPSAEFVVHPSAARSATGRRWRRSCSPPPTGGCGCGRTAGIPPLGTSPSGSA